jgi:FMN phosphatase YigB (HAD superfamily)
MKTPSKIVFLVDVDNTLLDNDRIQNDLKRHLEREFGAACRDRYWAILEELFTDLGYRDYLGALQRYRVEHPQDIHLLSMSSFLVDYPFANRLYPESLDVLERFRSWGETVILSDGDVVFQPRKVERSGISEAVDGNVLIYIHKEEALDDVERRYPAEHYVMVDDKLRILTAVKKAWGARVTTVFPRQGQFGRDQRIIAEYPPADMTVERIGYLLEYDRMAFLDKRDYPDRRLHSWVLFDVASELTSNYRNVYYWVESIFSGESEIEFTSEARATASRARPSGWLSLYVTATSRCRPRAPTVARPRRACNLRCRAG